MANKYPFYPTLPKLQIKGSSLFIQSPFLVKALSLFAYTRQVHFDNAKKQVTIRTKKWWEWQPPSKFRYSQIDYIDIAIPSFSGSGDDPIAWTYSVLLIARNPFQRIILVKFTGNQIQETMFRIAAEICADTISKHTGIRFGLQKKEVPLGDFQDKYVCKNCGHRMHPDSEVILCKYCGGQEIEIVAG